MRKDYFVKNLLAAMMLLAVSMGMVSCQGLVDAIVGTSDNPSSQPSQPSTQPTEIVVTPTAQGAKVEASSPEAVSEALASLVDDIKAKGVGDGKEYKVEVSTKDISTSTSDCTIEVPKVAGSNINIVFDNGVSTGSTPLVVKAAETASSTPTEAVNELTITVPDAQALNLSVDMPETTVTLKSSGSSTVFKSLVAKTAVNTLIIESGITVEELEIQGGSVVVKTGAAVNMLVCATDENMIGITEYGVTSRVSQDMQTVEPYAVDENGDPYYFKNLKVIKGTAPYASLHHLGTRPETYSLKTLIICDGAAVNNMNYNWEEIETIKGEGNAKYLYGSWWITEDGSEKTYFGGSIDFGNMKSMSGVTVSALWADKLDKSELMISGLPASMTDCTFKSTKIHAGRQKGANAISAKNCKFESYADKEAYLSVYSIEPNDGVSSFKATFDNCEFVENTLFEFYQSYMSEVTVYVWSQIIDGAVYPGGSSTSLDDVPEYNKNVGETKDRYDDSKNPDSDHPNLSMGYWKETRWVVLPIEKFDYTVAFNNCKYGGSALTSTTPVEAYFTTEVQGLNYFVEIDGTKYTPSTKWDEATGKSYWNLTKVE